MISFIRGRLADISPETMVLDVHGVGYEMYIPARMFEEYGRTYSMGDEVEICTHMQVREDDVSLFGFPSMEERRVFRMLIGVSGIGPKGALGILSGMSPEQLKLAVITDDAKLIARTPGIGLKTAQKLILELKDKFSQEELLPAEDGTGVAGVGAAGVMEQNQSASKEAILALVALGYGQSEAAKAVRGVSVDGEEMDAQQILKLALKNIM